MRIGIIIETNEPEKAWNGVRFGNITLKQGHEVKVFLMSAGVEIESIVHE
jgi:tRNA 2-thiouridine synthesizing protein D